MANINEAIRAFLISLEARGSAPKTIAVYQERLRLLGEYFEPKGIFMLDQVTQDHMDEYIVSLRRRNLSSASVGSYTQAIKAFFNWCVQRDHLIKSPARHLVKPRVKYSAKNKAIAQDDLDRMIAFTREHEFLMEEAMLVLISDTGCRSGELCSLDIDSVDLEKRIAKASGKTGACELDFTAACADVLARWIEKRKTIPSEIPALFLTPYGKRMYPDYVHHLFGKIGDRVDAGKCNPHSIRHRVGQGWIDKGANLELVRMKLRHASILTTSRYYANQDAERLRVATEKYSLLKTDV